MTYYPADVMAAFPPPEDQLEILTQGIDVALPEGELLERLRERKPLRVKLGVDPTTADVTLGWAVVLRLLRRFQELGHSAVLILGDFTALVGDPSERSSTRRRLDKTEVGQNVSEVNESIKSLLLEERLEVRRNSEWLGAMDMSDVLDLTTRFTVSRIMDRDDFQRRWNANEPISMVEFMYPLLQAMDSVAVEADVELGGSDQIFNLLVGRDLQERMGQRPQLVMTVPLLIGTDGSRKMSQSLGNYISINDRPEEMFGKTMSIPDEIMGDWFVLAAGISDDEASEIISGIANGSLHPGDTKRWLAREIVEIYWGGAAAIEAEAHFDHLFRDHGAPGEIAEHSIGDEDPVSLAMLLDRIGIVSSRSEARRLIAQGAVRLSGERVEGEHLSRERLMGEVISVGKRRFVRFVRDTSGDQ